MSNLPPLTDHMFWFNLGVQCNTTKSLSRIASDLGVDVDELVAWIEAYREPTAPKQPSDAKYGAPIGNVHNGGGAEWSLPKNAQRFAAWRKQQAGAAEARRLLEASL